MKLNLREIKECAKKDAESAWIDFSKTLPQKSSKRYSGGKGTSHPLHDLIQDVRKIFLESGFAEVENPVFVPEEEVYKQYGRESPVILDRIYYLAGLERPDIGISNERIEKIRGVADIDIDELKGVMREYRENKIEGDDLIEVMTRRLNVKTEKAIKIMNLFEEFKNITPVPSKMTLRSHMTGAWFQTIEAMKDGSDMPLMLFSIGLRFRREQKQDATHLRVHYGASCVIMDEDISIEGGSKITEQIFDKLGFKDVVFVKKEATSNYYAYDQEYEVFSKNIEIGDCGMYSPVVLANYNIEYPVFNLGFGLERMIMIKGGFKDVREVFFPQFYGKKELSDNDIAAQISIARKAKPEHIDMVERIKRTALENADAPSPCEFLAYEGDFAAGKIKVWITESESNAKLLGPAALNSIYVYDKNIYGVPRGGSDKTKEITDKGIKVDFEFIDAISHYFVTEMEERIKGGARSGNVRIKMAKGPSDINVLIGNSANQYITSKSNRIMLKGPVFFGIRFELSD